MGILNRMTIAIGAIVFFAIFSVRVQDYDQKAGIEIAFSEAFSCMFAFWVVVRLLRWILTGRMFDRRPQSVTLDENGTIIR